MSARRSRTTNPFHFRRRQIQLGIMAEAINRAARLQAAHGTGVQTLVRWLDEPYGREVLEIAAIVPFEDARDCCIGLIRTLADESRSVDRSELGRLLRDVDAPKAGHRVA
ncbi:hypothetical protein EU803_03935 [Loktanella sp. IMCC34160]|uniref:DUF6280 family protein n=1 Tax=Loktanella sp. IMCC34160 TaxID=2510646 RepID=UPI00101BFF9A|nr:DUF6280 family protein [Loktanella sp. IMCC34160]RYG93262.1 hypothetical protein EU803_03935 [Loktanella sp. IMCC34160]